MNKILMALAITVCTGYSAEAQKCCVCAAPAKGKVVYHKHIAAASQKNKFDQNFKVCKDAYGYKICGESRNGYNNTPIVHQPAAPGSNVRNYDSYSQVEDRRYLNEATDEQSTAQQPILAPEPQSYPPASINMTSSASYMGYYPKKSKIIVTYDNGTAPYEAEPSPQYDGPEKNKARNLKVNSPEQVSGDPSISLPPPSGEIKR